VIRVGLLDTTVPGHRGSMARYRELLLAALGKYYPDTFQLSVEYLGSEGQSSHVPRRFRMWHRHWQICKAARRLDTSGYDLLHLLDGSFGYVIKVMRRHEILATVHDVIPRMQMEGKFAGAPPVRRGARWLITQAIDGVSRCRRVCAISQSTARDLARCGCEPAGGIHVVPMAVDAEQFSGERLSPHDVGLDRPFVFHLGNNGFYKNRIGVIETFAKVDPAMNLMLVMAGPPADDTMRGLVARAGLGPRIVFAEDPDEDLLSRYYRGAAVFLFPSIYEGFGWPPLEAMSAGCPIVASTAGSLPEVIGTAGLTSDWRDQQGLAAQVQRLIRDNTLRDQQIAAGLERARTFCPQRLADQMAAQYESVVGSDQ